MCTIGAFNIFAIISPVAEPPVAKEPISRH